MSFWRNYYHLTWATKNRQPLIKISFEAQLYAYMVKKVAELGAFVYEINGMEDHSHIALTIPPKQSVADIVKFVKGSSSHYVNHVIRPSEHFSWQRGYGCLTVGEKQLQIAVNYVKNQKNHHSAQSTNAWIERYAEEDEGPAAFDARADEAKFIRDERASYDILGEFPF